MFRTTLALLATLSLALSFAHAKDEFKLGPESMEKADVPHGEIVAFPKFKSEIYPGSVYDFWVYVPKQYDDKTPACFMVFMDGSAYMNPQGKMRVPVVFDNLIHSKDIPVMIGIFIKSILGKIAASNTIR